MVEVDSNGMMRVEHGPNKSTQIRRIIQRDRIYVDDSVRDGIDSCPQSWRVASRGCCLHTRRGGGNPKRG